MTSEDRSNDRNNPKYSIPIDHRVSDELAEHIGPDVEVGLMDTDAQFAIQLLIDMGGMKDPVAVQDFRIKLTENGWSEDDADYLIRYLDDEDLIEAVLGGWDYIEIYTGSSLRNPDYCERAPYLGDSTL